MSSTNLVALLVCGVICASHAQNVGEGGRCTFRGACAQPNGRPIFCINGFCRDATSPQIRAACNGWPAAFGAWPTTGLCSLNYIPTRNAQSQLVCCDPTIMAATSVCPTSNTVAIGLCTTGGLCPPNYLCSTVGGARVCCGAPPVATTCNNPIGQCAGSGLCPQNYNCIQGININQPGGTCCQ